MLCVLASGDLLLLVGSLGFGDRCGLNKCSDCINVGGNGDVLAVSILLEEGLSTELNACGLVVFCICFFILEIIFIIIINQQSASEFGGSLKQYFGTTTFGKNPEAFAS
jgi:hypothetical protein